MPVYRRDPIAPPPIVNRRVAANPPPAERRVFADATASATSNREYVPSTPRRAFKEEALDPFATAAGRASAMSDAYSAMADNGVIPNQLRGYIGRDDMVAQRNMLASTLNERSGGNPYIARFASQTPEGLSAGGPLQHLGAWASVEGGGQRDVGDVAVNDIIGFTAQDNPILDYKRKIRMNAGQVGKNYIGDLRKDALNGDVNVLDKGFQTYRDYRNTYSLADDQREHNKKFGFTSDQIKQMRDVDPRRFNATSNGNKPISLNDGVVNQWETGRGSNKPELHKTSPFTNFTLDSEKDPYGTWGSKFGVQRQYPTLPEGMTADQMYAKYEDEQRSGKPGIGTKWRNDLAEMRRYENDRSNEQRLSAINRVKTALSNGTSRGFIEHDLRDILDQFPKSERANVLDYLLNEAGLSLKEANAAKQDAAKKRKQSG